MNNFFKIILLTGISISLLLQVQNSFSTPVFLELNPPHLNRIWIQGEPYKSDTAISSISTIFLPFGKNFFTVEFISINYNNQHKLQYGHQLVGIDSNWVHSGNQRRASYANLRPGIYPLKLKVSSDGRNWTQNTQKVNIIITPPFWAKWWYQGLVLVFIFLLLVVIYKVRVNTAINQVLEVAEIRKKESESLRLMMAQDFHDEMGNKLASIIVLVSTLQLLVKDKSKEVQQALFRIEKSSKQLFDGTKSFIWSINPESDQLGAIITYINKFGAELFENTPIGFSVVDTISAKDKEVRLVEGNSRQLFFIIKEAMTNALVHSNAKSIELSYSINRKADKFCISLEDNGIGVSAEQLNSSRGLNNMKTRASRINYKIAFFHNPNGGFGVKIDARLPARQSEFPKS